MVQKRVNNVSYYSIQWISSFSRPKLKEQVRYCDQHPEEIDTLVEVKAQFSEAKKCHKTSRRSAASGLEMRMPLHSVAPVARRGSFITQGTNAIGTTTLLQSAHAVLRGLEELVARHKILLTFSKIMLVSFIASHHQVIGAIESKLVCTTGCRSI
uniref:Uncharacterized protein n=2 Tax=Triticum urartu TaxID=4572 RepID=A0A8R7UYZ1_TRIUA